MVEALEIIAKPTALGVIVCLVIATFFFYLAYYLGTAETHEQCIAGDMTRDGGECYASETRPGPDILNAFFFGGIGIIFIGGAVQLIWKTRQHRKVTPTP